MALAALMIGSNRFAPFVMGFPWRTHPAETKTQRQHLVDDVKGFGAEVAWWTSTTPMLPTSTPVPPVGQRLIIMEGAKKEIVGVAKREQETPEGVASAAR